MVAVVVDTRCVKLSAIKLGTRHRKDLGNVKGLAESIKSHGLFHPVGITPDNELIFGYRRLEAVKSLGWTEIEVRVLPLESILEGEHDENECRKEFTPSERVAIADALRSFHHGGDRKSRENAGGNQEQDLALDPVTAEEAAKKAGLGNKETARLAKSVVESGTPELVEAMDAGEVSINAAAKLAELPKDEQRAALARIEAGEKPAQVVKETVPPKPKPKPRPASKPKPGSPKVDGRKFSKTKDLVGKLVREVTALKEHAGLANYEKEIREHLNDILRLLDAWHKEAAK